MSNTKSAKKSVLQYEKKRKRNASNRSKIRTLIKNTKIAIKNNDKETAQKKFILVQSILDKYETKNLIHKNKAARHKSKLSSLISNMKINKN